MLVLLLIQLCAAVDGNYHELSKKVLVPPVGLTNSYFGFSLGYRSDNIVVGAPYADSIGQVYECGINDVFASFNNSTTCRRLDIDVEKLRPSVRDFKYKNNFYLGASIASNDKYFLTCAPLWTYTYPYGKCFVYDGKAEAVSGSLDKYSDYAVGWSTAVDEEHKTVIIYCSILNNLRSGVAYVLSPLSYQYSSQLLLRLQAEIISGYAVTVGKFFSDIKHTIYAFSFLNNDLTGLVTFYSYEKKITLNDVKIVDDAVNAMFGSTMHATDINGDGVSELLVSAPAHSFAKGYDSGALHIYIGGKSNSIDAKDRRRTIYSNKNGIRFGTAVCSSDVDGDGIPEIFVSAPYEDEGSGTVYILSGSEIKNSLMKERKMQQEVNQLTKVQKLQSKRFKAFGFSLFVVPDIDNNGCKELAVGSPKSENVVLYRCIPTFNVSITSKVKGYETVPEAVNVFFVTVCIKLSYPLQPNNIHTNLTIKNTITSKMYGKQDLMTIDKNAKSNSLQYDIRLSKTANSFCRQIEINVTNADPDSYNFTTVIIEEDFSKKREFNSNWLMMSEYSVRKRELIISRGCDGVSECTPILNISLGWSIRTSTYHLGETSTENVTISVKNTGTSAYNACVKTRTSGARLLRSSLYYLPKPFRNEHELTMNLDMTGVTNEHHTIEVLAELYKICDQEPVAKQTLTVPVEMDTTNIFIQGSAVNINVKEKDIYNETMKYLIIEHYYIVSSNDTFAWRNLQAYVTVNNTPFLKHVDVHGDFKENFVSKKDNGSTILFDIEPRKSVKIYASIVLFKDIAMEHLKDQHVNITSTIEFRFLPTDVIKGETLQSKIVFQEISIDQNKSLMVLIFVLLGFLMLALIIFALLKLGFFKRKEKTKLNELKKEIRRQSVLGSTRAELAGVDMQLETNDNLAGSSMAK